MTEQFIVLGASGWIGHYLLSALNAFSTKSKIFAICRNRRLTCPVSSIEVIQTDNFLAAIERLQEATLINLNRGEEEGDFLLHLDLIAHQNDKNSRYIYASSFNALDADDQKEHQEVDRPNAKSEYGKFKAKCEIALLEFCKRPTVFRCAAVHGWAPNRIARTEAFLARLKRGERVSVSRGVLQNRSFVGDLAEQIVLLATDKNANGVYHLGTDDFSEEYDFLKNLGQAFGYSESQVIEGEPRPSNAVMLMDRMKREFPDYRIPKESETISRVARQNELQKYRYL